MLVRPLLMSANTRPPQLAASSTRTFRRTIVASNYHGRYAAEAADSARDQPFVCSARRISAFESNFGSRTLRACSAPTTGRRVGSSNPTCASSEP
jgi:hypothetical protein